MNVSAVLKALVEGIQTTFGAGVALISFFGLALLSLVWGGGNFAADARQTLVYWLMGAMGLVWIILFGARVFKPEALCGPPQPKTENVTFEASTIENPSLPEPQVPQAP